MDNLAAEVDRVVFTPYPTQLKVGDKYPPDSPRGHTNKSLPVVAS